MEGLRTRGFSLGAAALSGILLFAAGEPLGFGALAWVALIPLFVVVLREKRPAWSALYGFSFAFAYFAVELSWIFLFGWMAWTALTVYLCLWTSAGTFLVGLVRERRTMPLLAAGIFAGVELAKDRWPYGGFPWGAVGTTQSSIPGVRWLAGVIGVYGLTFLCVFVSALLAMRIARAEWSGVSVAPVALALLVFMAVDVLGYGRPPLGRPYRIAVVQGGVPRPARPDQNDVIVRNHIELTREVLSRGPVDLVVWPESSIANSAAVSGLQAVKALAVESGTPFLVGRSFFTQDAYFNLVEHVSADGRLQDTYAKRHPVPFGEYVPISFLRSAVGTLQSQIPVDQRPGTTPTVFRIEGRSIAAPVCFESVFPRDVLDFARRGAEVFVLSTNNSSFEHSYASQQHIAHGRMRALETRQWVVQAALAGISAVLGPDGSVSNGTALFDSIAFTADVRARTSQSLYAVTGDLFPSIFAGLAGLVVLVSALQSIRATSKRSEDAKGRRWL